MKLLPQPSIAGQRSSLTRQITFEIIFIKVASIIMNLHGKTPACAAIYLGFVAARQRRATHPEAEASNRRGRARVDRLFAVVGLT
ncbi:MAG: hypothetical protein LBV61_03595 [Burkholderiaceae bacterium]|jgi:hypothetical protein|nr:hypothetical protein [Burkholderiaceae bacterium]